MSGLKSDIVSTRCSFKNLRLYNCTTSRVIRVRSRGQSQGVFFKVKNWNELENLEVNFKPSRPWCVSFLFFIEWLRTDPSGISQDRISKATPSHETPYTHTRVGLILFLKWYNSWLWVPFEVRPMDAVPNRDSRSYLFVAMSKPTQKSSP